jgi:hypothetical protein
MRATSISRHPISTSTRGRLPQRLSNISQASRDTHQAIG